jgi:uncharacterized protein (DUF1810 family)
MTKHDLSRYLDAQVGNYDSALSELRAGRKRTHWMWFVFPQIAGLGTSDVARRFAIRDRAEAAAFLSHPILGTRLRESTAVLLAQEDIRVAEVFGYPDDLKFHSCMSLFAAVAENGSEFHQALERFFNGTPDAKTVRLLGDS